MRLLSLFIFLINIYLSAYATENKLQDSFFQNDSKWDRPQPLPSSQPVIPTHEQKVSNNPIQITPHPPIAEGDNTTVSLPVIPKNINSQTASSGLPPVASPDVTNLAPTSVAAPIQTLPTSETPRNKVTEVTTSNTTNINTIKPVELSIEEKEIDKAISFIVDGKKSNTNLSPKMNRQNYNFKTKSPKVNKEDLQIPLMKAVLANNIGAVQAFLDQGASINEQNYDNGFSLLMFAISKKADAVSRMLLARGADINARAIDGSTAIHIAARNNDLNAINLLLEFKADIFLRDNKEKIAFEYLQPSLREKAAYIMARECEAKDSCLLYAVVLGSYNATHFLLKRGADINAINANGDTALIIASKLGDFNLINLLLLEGADPRIINQENLKAIDYAIARKDLQTAKVLDTVAIKFDLESQ